MVHPKLKLVRAMVLPLLHLMEHPLVTVPPPQPMEATDKRSLKLDPAEPTLVLEPPALMEDTTSPPLQQRHFPQPRQGGRPSMEDTLVLLLSPHLLFYQRGKINLSSIQR